MSRLETVKQLALLYLKQRGSFVFGRLGLAAVAFLAVAATGQSSQSSQSSQAPTVLNELPATANQLERPLAQNSPVLAADPMNTDFIALGHRLDAPGFGCVLQVSDDGGRLWVPADPVPELPQGVDRCYAPELAFDDEGTLYYLFVGLAGSGNEPVGGYLTVSTDGARSFSSPQRVVGPENYQMRMAVDGNERLHLVWLHSSADAPTGGLPTTPNPILYAYSDDRGETFSQPVQVSDADRVRAVAPTLAVTPDGGIQVIYYDLQGDFRDYQGLEGPTWNEPWVLVATSSVDAGKSFTRGVAIDTEIIPPERVMLIFTMPPPTAGIDRENVYVAWHDARNGDWDVFLSKSPDFGESWSDPVRVNDDVLGNGSHQYLPRLSISSDDRVDMIFYDRRDDAANRQNHVYYTYSTDHAASFSRNMRLTSESSDSRIGQTYAVESAKGLVEFGSRIALLSKGDSVAAAWTDTRNALQSPHQDIFTTLILHPSANTSWPILLAAIGGGFTLVLVIGLARLRRSTAIDVDQHGRAT